MEMARRARSLRKDKRLSAERVVRVLSTENPERDKLEGFGRDGVPVPVSAGFEACGVEGRPKFRRKYTEARWAVDKMIFEGFRAQGLAFILPLSIVDKLQTRVHFSPLSWAPKQGKAKGRNICDTGDKGNVITQSLTSPFSTAVLYHSIVLLIPSGSVIVGCQPRNEILETSKTFLGVPSGFDESQQMSPLNSASLAINSARSLIDMS